MPYIAAYGNITKALQGIQKASTPDRFTLDFLATKLGMKGGSSRPVIPYLKKTGFLGPDGTPTGIYKRFRNHTQAGAAAAEALRIGFGALYEINEYAHELNETELRGVVVQATGLEETASTVKSIMGSFKALRAFANFETAASAHDDAEVERTNGEPERNGARLGPEDFRLGYTINLNLPATSDIAVFNAIFKSLREHILG
jgi:Family of unknown function (DUF5343)